MDFNKVYGEADWADGGVTPPIALNWRGGAGKLLITATGTVDFDIEESNSDIQNGETARWITSAYVDGATGNANVAIDPVPRFIRIRVNSSTTATLTLDYVQSDV